jgi:hypothetical protein
MQPSRQRRRADHDDGNRNGHDDGSGSGRIGFDGHGSGHDDDDDRWHRHGRRTHLQRARLDERVFAMDKLLQLLVAIVLVLRR